jgi:hypothetical protein
VHWIVLVESIVTLRLYLAPSIAPSFVLPYLTMSITRTRQDSIMLVTQPFFKENYIFKGVLHQP